MTIELFQISFLLFPHKTVFIRCHVGPLEVLNAELDHTALNIAVIALLQLPLPLDLLRLLLQLSLLLNFL